LLVSGIVRDKAGVGLFLPVLSEEGICDLDCIGVGSRVESVFFREGKRRDRGTLRESVSSLGGGEGDTGRGGKEKKASLRLDRSELTETDEIDVELDVVDSAGVEGDKEPAEFEGESASGEETDMGVIGRQLGCRDYTRTGSKL
jgi:hypothetical protein